MNTLLQIGTVAIMINDHDWLPEAKIQSIAFDALKQNEIITLDHLAAHIVVGLDKELGSNHVMVMARFDPKPECCWLELVERIDRGDRETTVMLQLHWRGPRMDDALVSEMLW